jgi:zinc protease
MNAPVQIGATRRRMSHLVTPGGIEVWLVSEHQLPLVAMEFCFRQGAVGDDPSKPGTTTMLSGLMDEGAGPLDARAFHEALADRAIELRFDAGFHWFQGSIKSLTRHFDEATRLTRLALMETRLDAEPIERVRAQMLADVRHGLNDPDVVAQRAFHATAFGGHPYAQPVDGTVESLSTITRADLEAARARILNRSGLVVAVVGDIDAQTLAPLVDRMFADLPERPLPLDAAAIRPNGLGQILVRELDVPNTTFVFGGPGLLRKDPDFAAAALVNHVLGEGSFTSRLWQEVRESRGLAYSVRTRFQPLEGAPIWTGYTATKNERAREALDVIRSEIERMGRDGPTAEELEAARTYLIGAYGLRFDTSTKIANEIVNLVVDGLGVDYIDRRETLLRAVTLDDAKRVAHRLFGQSPFLTAAAGKPVPLT